MTRLTRRRTPWWVWALLALVILIAAAALGAYVYVRGLFGAAGGAPFTLSVKPGDSLPTVARTLETRHIVKNARVLRYVMDKNGTAGKLKEGLYDLTGRMTVDQVAATLAGPARLPTVNVTVPEGRRIRDMPAIFAKAGFDGAALQGVLKDEALSPYAKGKQPDLEGFVFPDTYSLRPKETPRQIVQTMLERMNREFTPANIALAKAQGLGVREWVILASMVQAEAAGDQEMPIVAGIFLNRLKEGIALGSDPTVAYGLGKNLPELDRSAGDFKKDTPYSTYTRQGLPAGPINSPGKAALQSVLSPVLTMTDGRSALYFVHGLDGKIHVNHDYPAHLRDVARYR
ncbi:endolytic transglycosylase MltG [Deinococcus sp.]|uniref:endolytic transglycosylase MltG n=1 Tax=Deinococcus sp. TaxID=47478 RepID=UPI002869CBC0|nr:endolytic transglycosylase MltG [Deinococcus sp.]